MPINGGHTIPPYLTTNLEGRFGHGKSEKFCVDATPGAAIACDPALRSRYAGRRRERRRCVTIPDYSPRRTRRSQRTPALRGTTTAGGNRRFMPINADVFKKSNLPLFPLVPRPSPLVCHAPLCVILLDRPVQAGIMHVDFTSCYAPYENCGGARKWERNNVLDEVAYQSEEM